MYSHAFATLFLAEVYGMVEREDVKRTLQRSVDLIVDSQNAEGGWRYKPFARESDMSITVCQVLALRSARNVGIHVPTDDDQATRRTTSTAAPCAATTAAIASVATAATATKVAASATRTETTRAQRSR